MMKGQQKLYQNMTAKEIIEELNKYKISIIAAIEYIYLHEEREKNAKKKENNINQS